MGKMSLSCSDSFHYCADSRDNEMKSMTLSLVIALTLPAAACCQESIPRFSVGARNVSLGDANISESSDVSVMYENPAALGFLENNSVLLNHSQEYGPGEMQENVAVPLVLGNPVALAVGLDAFHAGYLSRQSPITPRIFEYGYDIAFAATATPTLSFGGSAVVRHGATGGLQAWGAYFNVGADYAPTPDLSYSVVFGGLGRDVSYYSEDSTVSVSTSTLPKTLEIGATLTYPSSASLRPPVFILSLANEKIFDIKGVYYKGGIEIRPFHFLGLRFGYIAGPGVASARYGIGFIGKFFCLQYAVYSEQKTRTLLQELSLSVGL